MDLKQAIEKRHTVRKFLDKPLTADNIKKLETHINDLNKTLTPNAHVVGILVIGYGATQGHPHKSKNAQSVATYDGNPPQ